MTYWFPLVVFESGPRIYVATYGRPLTWEAVEVGVCVDYNFDCGPSCRIGLLYCRRCLPYGARRICFFAYHTFDVAQDILLSRDSVPKLLSAVVAMSVLLFLSRRRWSVGGRVIHDGRCGIPCTFSPLLMSSYGSICLLLVCV